MIIVKASAPDAAVVNHGEIHHLFVWRYAAAGARGMACDRHPDIALES